MLRQLRLLLGKVFWKAALILTNTSPRNDVQWFTIERGLLKGVWLQTDISLPFVERMRSGDFEKFIYEVLHARQFDFAGKTIWDVGAHIGYHMLMFAELVGENGKVVAFEPNPVNMDRLKRHTTRNPTLGERITLLECALASTDGEGQFLMGDGDSNSDLGFLSDSTSPSDRVSPRTYHKFHAQSVAVRSADSLTRTGIGVPDLIKIDVEGGEYAVICGAHELLAKHRPILAIEVHNIQMMHDLGELFYEVGYRSHIMLGCDQSSSRTFVLAEPRH